MRIAIVGAGLAGLSCAQALRAGGIEVTLFDKGRGAGGRMATRRIETTLGVTAFDHGAQYFTARDPAFCAEVQAWATAGLASRWAAAGEDAWVGAPAMNAPLKALAADLDVRWATRVDTVERDAAGWSLAGDGWRADGFDALISALPAEQTAALLGDAAPALAAIAAATPSEPCWTAMAVFADRLPTPADVHKSEGPAAWAARNSAKPGRTGPEAWVVQASPDWSRRRLEDEPTAVAPDLLGFFLEAAALPAIGPVHLSAHRWRYARSGRARARELWDGRLRIGACGDWLIGPRVENAWLSGRELARAVLDAT
jgi:renalase